MWVKICGIRDSGEAELALSYGVDALGYVIGGRRLTNPVDPPTAREIVETFLATHVLVTHITDSSVLSLADYLGVDAVQLAEPVPVSLLEELSDLGYTIVKTIVADGPRSLSSQISRYAPYSDVLLVDTAIPGKIGGTGRRHPLYLDILAVELSPIPVVVAGGLNPQNVASVVRFARPWGVDVLSGVRRAGSLDPVLLSQFLRAVRYAIVPPPFNTAGATISPDGVSP